MKFIIDGLRYGKAIKAFGKKKYSAAEKLFEKLCERSGGANYHLGMIYFHGLGRAVDYKCALDYFLRAEKLFYADSKFYIAWCYERLEDYEVAAHIYRSRIDIGDVKSIFRLAFISMSGRVKCGVGDIEETLMLGVNLEDAACECLLAEYYLKNNLNRDLAVNLLINARQKGLIRAGNILNSMSF